jgi:transposase
MRGRTDDQALLFHVFSVEDRIRPDHPLRDIKRRCERILETLVADFAKAYSRTGRPSVPPERLLKALLLMALYSIRSERQLCERIDTDLLFRWFLDLQPGDEVFDPTTFTHNRDRLREHDLTQKFFAAVVDEALTRNLCSEHFSVDGTLIESHASAKSFQPIPAKDSAGKNDAGKNDAGKNEANHPPKDGNGFKPRNVEVDFHGQKRTNATHRSTTDPESRLYRKGVGKESKLAHLGHALGENRHGLILGVAVTEANGTAERSAALDLIDALKVTHQRTPKTLGSDKGYDSGEYYRDLESRGVEPHGAMIEQRLRSPADVKPAERANCEARHRMKARQTTEGYRLSQRCRKKLEEGFGWLKSIAGLGRSRVVGRWKLQQLWEVGAAAYNLVRLRKLAPVV